MRVDPLEKALAGCSTVVTDANLAADAVLGEPARRALALRFFKTCHTTRVQLLAPPTFAAEADSVVRLTVHAGKLAPADAAATYAVLDSLVVQVVLDASELNIVRARARVIAEMLQQPRVYDATYAALAEVRGCLFWTADKTFANAAKQKRRQPDGTTAPALPVVRYVGDY